MARPSSGVRHLVHPSSGIRHLVHRVFPVALGLRAARRWGQANPEVPRRHTTKAAARGGAIFKLNGRFVGPFTRKVAGVAGGAAGEGEEARRMRRRAVEGRHLLVGLHLLGGDVHVGCQ